MEILISEIKKRGVLWNRSHCGYKDRRSAEKEWSEVAKKVGIPKEDAKKKWRNLRDQFSKELKKVPKLKSEASQNQSAIYTGKWRYFKSLLFLKDALTPRETYGNLSMLLEDSTTATEADKEVSNDEANDIGLTIAEIQSCTKFSPVRPKRKRIHQDVNDVEAKLLDIKTKKHALFEAVEDENSLFLRSLHPFMKKLDPIRQLRLHKITYQQSMKMFLHLVLSFV
ncbi:uncharacterized protein LOC105215197 isoform X2 [Zeugodacus cucurbitae]|uniref:uncharacterized protein LOC105215197 isoform X2 n=1 Tax=Zeugodacus cucurbitae TaxID=28588 RepID=UPI0010A74E39|nr:uncharacterized protein LOC105215197 isoform X2 [Zeugodacus cucurbitae]